MKLKGNHPSIQWVPQPASYRLKRPGCWSWPHTSI